MTLIQKDFEFPEGTTITQANVGASQTPASVGGSITAVAVAKAHGDRGVQITNGAGNAALIRFALAATSETVRTSVVFSVKDTVPEVDTNLFGIRNATGSAIRLQWRTSGQFAILDLANTISVFTGVTPAVNTRYRLTTIASRSGGTVTAKLYNDVTKAQVGATLTLTGRDFGTTSFAAVDIGQSTGGTAKTTYYDDLQFDETGTAELAEMTDPIVPSTTAVPISITSNAGGWTGTAADLADSNTATYVESPAAPVTNAASRYRLGPLVTPSTFSLTVSNQLTAASASNTAYVRLYQGATLRKEWSFTPTTAVDNRVLTLTTGEISTITDWTALDVELSWTGQ